MKLFYFLILFLFTSCSATTFYSGSYLISLQQVEKITSSSNSYIGNIVQPVNHINPFFEDSLIKINWLWSPNQMVFNLTNKSSNTMWIIWNNAIFIDTEGFSNRVSHAEVKRINVSNYQVPSPIARNSKLSDFVIPIKNVDIDHIKPLFEYYSTDPTQLQKYKLQNVGKTFSILLPIKTNKILNEYIFTFKLNDLIYDPLKEKSTIHSSSPTRYISKN